ncbi:SHOCT domain-containing protein [Allorhizobium sp. BGMRC 0089]|uniref:SHOCT domain-containing protein n=1 Tax=Allorhizobium sonneratiae TaxID=2934936 RepID=UPI0020331E19|nr:SHOCT domain-containing protein [Allorhizobium sonneratiae]MCM2293607.1 SHOCT domain-containing protein [Allorhizobium sonneratiae]
MMTAIAFLRHRLSTPARLAATGLVLALAGCAATHYPTPALAPSSYVDKDGYPEFSKPITAANQQMGNSAAKTMQDRLTALAGLHDSGKISDQEYKRRLKAIKDAKDASQ